MTIGRTMDKMYVIYMLTSFLVGSGAMFTFDRQISDSWAGNFTYFVQVRHVRGFGFKHRMLFCQENTPRKLMIGILY